MTRMWSYWKGKYGCVAACAENQYPERLKQHPELQHAVSMVKIGQEAIDSIMERLDREEEDHE